MDKGERKIVKREQKKIACKDTSDFKYALRDSNPGPID